MYICIYLHIHIYIIYIIYICVLCLYVYQALNPTRKAGVPLAHQGDGRGGAVPLGRLLLLHPHRQGRGTPSIVLSENGSSQGQNPALIGLFVPSSLDSGATSSTTPAPSRARSRHPAAHTLHPTPTPYTLYPALCTLHLTPYTYTLHPIPCTLHPTPYTLHPAALFFYYTCTVKGEVRAEREHFVWI